MPQPETGVEEAGWPELVIARVLVKTKRGPVIPGNYFYAVKHKPDEASDIETEPYAPVDAIRKQERQRVREVLESLERLYPCTDEVGVLMEAGESGEWLNRDEALAALDSLEDSDA